MKRKDHRISSAHIYKKGKHNKWLMGEEVWSELGDEMLSEEGKKLVAADPDLSEITLRRLLLLQGYTTQENFRNTFAKLSQDEESDDRIFEANERAQDVSFALLSLCIKDDLSATWAEIVARYAAIRRTPFLETALALKALVASQGSFFYYADNGDQIIPWTPRKAPVKRGSMDRNTDLESEWGLLASKNRFAVDM